MSQINDFLAKSQKQKPSSADSLENNKCVSQVVWFSKILLFLSRILLVETASLQTVNLIWLTVNIFLRIFNKRLFDDFAVSGVYLYVITKIIASWYCSKHIIIENSKDSHQDKFNKIIPKFDEKIKGPYNGLPNSYI